MATTKTYNGIEFIVMEGFELGDNLVSFVKFASKEDAETALERALCEYAKDEPMIDFWSVRAELESGEEVELVLTGNDCGETPWSCGVIKYRLDGESYYESEHTDNYEDYRMIGDLKEQLSEISQMSDEDIADNFGDIWAERFAGAVRMYPDEFTEEEKKQAQRLVLALTHGE